MAELINNTAFLESEFKAMDEDEDGYLSQGELYEMLIYQGVEMDQEEIENELKILQSFVDFDCFVQFMNNLPSRTRKLREIFFVFNKNENSLEATKEDVLIGLEKLGIENQQKLVEEMMNEDNELISYENFARLYFKAKDFLF